MSKMVSVALGIKALEALLKGFETSPLELSGGVSLPAGVKVNHDVTSCAVRIDVQQEADV